MSTPVPPSSACIHVEGGEGLEKRSLTLGFIPLTDCALLVMAKEKGFFARHGLDVTLSREVSWANVRDKVATGALDAAQMLAGMPIASTLGIDAFKVPMLTAFSMDLNGNAITVSRELYARMEAADPQATQTAPVSARALKAVIDSDRAQGRPPLTFAHVFPYSPHNYELRYWLAAGGVHPDRDVRLIVVPPPQMVDQLQAGNIDGYCVGEPWNERAVCADTGRVVVTNYEIWNNVPEKVLGVTHEWAQRHPNTHRALLRALLETAAWVDRAENRDETVRAIAREEYVDAPVDVVSMSMSGGLVYARGEEARQLADFNVFHRYAANFPWRSHAEWFITQMYRWGQIEAPVDIRQAADTVYRPDIYRLAAADLGLPVPLEDRKEEGGHTGAWELATATAPIPMGPDRFLDGRRFSPTDPLGYLAGFDVHSRRVDMAALATMNAAA